jgi:predicted acyltransferase
MATEPSNVPVTPASAAKTQQPGNDRLLSLDALRGFDMFWIVGGSTLALALAGVAVGGKAPQWLSTQMKHPAWNGFTFYDLIFPLFIFLVGVAIPFSFAKHIASGEARRQLYWRICRRTVLLVLMGMIYNGLLSDGFAHLRYPSVLGRIGLAYFFAAIITLHSSARGRAIWIVILLVGYWAALIYMPVPGFGAGNLEPGKTLADFIDRSLVPGKLLHSNRDPEGLFSTIPAIATALFGVLAGQWLRESQRSGLTKAAALMIAGAVCLALGGLWNLSFPINKNLWSSSYTLWTAGWSLLLMAIFYLVIDVWGWKKWAFFFVVIGANAITIYMAARFIDFTAVGELLFGRAPIPKALLPSTAIVVEWLLLYVLYRSRTFLRL